MSPRKRRILSGCQYDILLLFNVRVIIRAATKHRIAFVPLRSSPRFCDKGGTRKKKYKYLMPSSEIRTRNAMHVWIERKESIFSKTAAWVSVDTVVRVLRQKCAYFDVPRDQSYRQLFERAWFTCPKTVCDGKTVKRIMFEYSLTKNHVFEQLSVEVVHVSEK